MSLPQSKREPDLPAYLQIEGALAADIAGLQPGDAVPTEHELCERFGVSRMTARAGVARLVDQGMLHRVRGRGTFVSRAQVHRQSGRLLSFSEDMHARGLSPSSRILEVAQQIATPDEAHHLDLGPGTRVVLIRRERLADDTPMALERTLLIPDCAGVLGADLERGSLHEALSNFGRTPTVAKGTITPRPADRDDAATFAIPIGAPLLVEARIVFDATDTPIELHRNALLTHPLHLRHRFAPTPGVKRQSAGRLRSYIGLVPARTDRAAARLGSITDTGSGHARRLLPRKRA